MMFKLIVIATLFYSSFALAENNCAELFETQNKIEDTIENLAELKITLDTAKAKGSSAIELTALAESFKNKSTEFYKYVRKNNLMTKEQFINRMRQEIEIVQNDQQKILNKKEEVEVRNSHARELKDSVIEGSRLIMNRIEPGRFEMGNTDKKRVRVIKKPFEMAATQTTQVVWRKVVELAHVKLGDEYKDLITDPSNFKGDTRPLENVSYNNVELWIKALNELSQSGDLALVEILPNHKSGDVYRLPTEAEWEFVIRGRGHLNDEYFFGNNKSESDKYVWFDKNSDMRTQPVATRGPLEFEDKQFYDMVGNVWEFTSSLYARNDDRIAVRGGSWAHADYSQTSDSRLYADRNETSIGVGFRLVKDLGAKK